jgi:acyl-CoA oxidase
LLAFQHREKTTLASAAQRIKKLIDSGLDPYDAFNIVQHQMIDVAQAYLERVVLSSFKRPYRTLKTKQQSYVEIISVVCTFKLKKKGWYLEDGYMEAVKTKARKMVNQLCWEIRPDAVSLVKAFDIPDSCLAAPIAL